MHCDSPTFEADRPRKYLGAEIGPLNTKLDTCGTLKFGVLAAALRLTLPSSLGARHAFVCRRRGGVAAEDQAASPRRHARRMCAAGPVTLRSVVQ